MWPHDVTKNDLRIEYFRGSGKGGQHRNKRDTACRITHLPTGTQAKAEDQRSREQNLRTAFQRLAKRLAPQMRQALQTDLPKPNEAIVRTYHKPDQRVTDKRLRGEQWTYDGVLTGKELDEIVQSLVFLSGPSCR